MNKTISEQMIVIFVVIPFGIINLKRFYFTKVHIFIQFLWIINISAFNLSTYNIKVSPSILTNYIIFSAMGHTDSIKIIRMILLQ